MPQFVTFFGLFYKSGFSSGKSRNPPPKIGMLSSMEAENVLKHQQESQNNLKRSLYIWFNPVQLVIKLSQFPINFT
jgi:hypothetical protein